MADEWAQYASPKGPTQPSAEDRVREAARKLGVDEHLARAVGNRESRFKNGQTSSAGAAGIMQLMPKTAASLGVTDPMDEGQNIEAGVRYLKDMEKQFPDDTAKQLAGYNFGPGNVSRGKPYPKETTQYIANVLKDRDAYAAAAKIDPVAEASKSSGGYPISPPKAPVVPALGEPRRPTPAKSDTADLIDKVTGISTKPAQRAAPPASGKPGQVFMKKDLAKPAAVAAKPTTDEWAQYASPKPVNEANQALRGTGLSVSPPRSAPTPAGLQGKPDRAGSTMPGMLDVTGLARRVAPQAEENVWEGGMNMADPSMERTLHGAHQVASGVAQAALPAAVAATGLPALPTAMGRAGLGYLAQRGVDKTAEALGVKQGYREALGDIAGLAAASFGPKGVLDLVRRKFSSTPPPAPPAPPAAPPVARIPKAAPVRAVRTVSPTWGAKAPTGMPPSVVPEPPPLPSGVSTNRVPNVEAPPPPPVEFKPSGVSTNRVPDPPPPLPKPSGVSTQRTPTPIVTEPLPKPSGVSTQRVPTPIVQEPAPKPSGVSTQRTWSSSTTPAATPEPTPAVSTNRTAEAPAAAIAKPKPTPEELAAAKLELKKSLTGKEGAAVEKIPGSPAADVEAIKLAARVKKEAPSLAAEKMTPETYQSASELEKGQIETRIREMKGATKAKKEEIIKSLKGLAKGGVVLPKRKLGRISSRGIYYGPKKEIK